MQTKYIYIFVPCNVHLVIRDIGYRIKDIVQENFIEWPTLAIDFFFQNIVVLNTSIFEKCCPEYIDASICQHIGRFLSLLNVLLYGEIYSCLCYVLFYLQLVFNLFSTPR